MPQHSEGSLFERLRNFFRKNYKQTQQISAIAYLPQEAVLMNGAVKICLPVDFSILRSTSEQLTLFGRKCGLILTVTRTPFHGQLQQMTEAIFSDAFLEKSAVAEILSFKHDFVRYSPRLTVHYINRRTDGNPHCIVVLLQRNELVYNLLFTGNVEQNLSTIEMMIATMQP